MNRVKQVIESAGDPTRSEFHRGWHGACQMVKAALSVDEDEEKQKQIDVRDRIKSILSSGITSIPDWWRGTLNDAIEEVTRLRAHKMNIESAMTEMNRLLKTAQDDAEDLRRENAALVEAQHRLLQYLPGIVNNAMLTMWDEICSDTGCHPLDIDHGKGKFLTFTPRHWTRMAGEMIAVNVRSALHSATETKGEPA